MGEGCGEKRKKKIEMSPGNKKQFGGTLRKIFEAEGFLRIKIETLKIFTMPPQMIVCLPLTLGYQFFFSAPTGAPGSDTIYFEWPNYDVTSWSPSECRNF